MTRCPDDRDLGMGDQEEYQEVFTYLSARQAAHALTKGFVAWVSILCLSVPGSASAAGTQVTDSPPPLATVNGVVVSVEEYSIELREQARRRFYHGKPAESQLEQFRQEIAEGLIEQALLLQEAKRRGIVLDVEAVEREIDNYHSGAETRSKDPDHEASAFWQALRRRVERKQLIEQLRFQVETGIVLTQSAIKTYYQAHPEAFTEPSRSHVYLILLKVDPSSTAQMWSAVEKEAQRLVVALREEGEDFAELARLHSKDESAQQGGDMGYLHAGMLGDPVQSLIDKLALDEVSNPFRVLEGYGIFKVVARQRSQLHPFEPVRERAESLWLKEAKHNAWRALIEGLRARADIRIDEQYIISAAHVRGEADGNRD